MPDMDSDGGKMDREFTLGGSMQFTAVIFDLDGVLVHTDHFHYLAWKKIADEKNIEFNPTINNRLRGVSRMESLEIILERYAGTPLSDKEKEEMAETKNEYYKELLKTMKPTDVDMKVRQTLNHLKEKGIRLAVGSSSKNAKFILKQVELEDVFDAVSDGTNIRRSKPDPEVFLKAAEYLGVRQEECLVVEDADAGIIAAKNAGMKAAGIGEASHCKDADYGLHCFSDLAAVVS